VERKKSFGLQEFDQTSNPEALLLKMWSVTKTGYKPRPHLLETGLDLQDRRPVGQVVSVFGLPPREPPLPEYFTSRGRYFDWAAIDRNAETRSSAFATRLK
jgi:hypothetical protein